MNPRKRMFNNDKNVHMRNQIFIFGSEVEKEQANKNYLYQSEYHRTYEEASKLVINGEG